MAERIVHILEVVEIEKEQATGFPGGVRVSAASSHSVRCSRFARPLSAS
jgi:hypothetical protein